MVIIYLSELQYRNIHEILKSSSPGWWVRFNFRLEVRCWILPNVRDSSVWMIRRHVITNLIHHGGYFSLLPPGRVFLLFSYFGCTKNILLLGIWMTLHARRILHAPGAISVHVSISPGEPRTLVLRSEQSTLLRDYGNTLESALFRNYWKPVYERGCA